MNIKECIEESLRIENIHREATESEIEEFNRFMDLKEITVADLEQFVRVYDQYQVLREQHGMDLRVGNHIPPRGGPEIRRSLQELLFRINSGDVRAWEAHVLYEMLHPFTDCNGRSGRMIWYWMMGKQPFYILGFLHSFYYQTLANSKKVGAA